MIEKLLVGLILFSAGYTLFRRHSPGVALVNALVTSMTSVVISRGDAIRWGSHVPIGVWWLAVCLCVIAVGCSTYRYVLTFRRDT